MIRELFGQAAIGPNPTALRAIQRDEIDLATWQSSLSDQAAAYFASLDLDSLYDSGTGGSHYFQYIARQKFSIAESEDHVRNTRRAARELLAPFPDNAGKGKAVIELARMTLELFRATGENSTNVVLIAFKPYSNEESGLHTHPDDRFIGNVTLAGKGGMVWRPRANDNNLEIQSIDAGNFSIFKGPKLDHGTPSARIADGMRLGAVMLTPYRNNF